MTMIRRILPDKQLGLFGPSVLYLSQADAAKHMDVAVRSIQYWEAEGLLHPEKAGLSRKRQYTMNDLVEMRFIKGMINKGFSVPSLKEKLKQLEAPYYYDADNLFWDSVAECWKTREMIAAEKLEQIKAKNGQVLGQALRVVASQAGSMDDNALAGAVAGIINDIFCGRAPRIRKPKPKRKNKDSGFFSED